MENCGFMGSVIASSMPKNPDSSQGNMDELLTIFPAGLTKRGARPAWVPMPKVVSAGRKYWVHAPT
jgi:hypothetical protein